MEIDMGIPHKHADVIRAYADGFEVECKGINGNWNVCINPNFHTSNEYRIKPEPKPDVVEFQAQTSSGGFTSWYEDISRWNGTTNKHDYLGMIKRVRDGETGRLKSAEVLS